MELPLVSIAICTYNGSAFIVEQLNSVINQTYDKCEIIIVDDCSKDDTFFILKQYAAKHAQISLYVNEANLGYTRNFEKAIGLCNGEFIALCDQDDIWDLNKISIMIGRIGDNILAYHDSAFIDQEGKPLDRKLSDVRNCYSGDDSRVFLFENCVLGHAILFKKELLPFIGKFNDTVIHDRWIAYVATNNGNIVYVNEALVQYRQHINANTNILKQERTNVSKSDSIEKLRFQVDIIDALADYPFNKDLPFKKELQGLMHDRMHSYTSFSLTLFLLKHSDILFYIRKKSQLSKVNLALKFCWGYRLKNFSPFIVNS